MLWICGRWWDIVPHADRFSTFGNEHVRRTSAKYMTAGYLVQTRNGKLELAVMLADLLQRMLFHPKDQLSWDWCASLMANGAMHHLLVGLAGHKAVILHTIGT
jgi:hypothetical protein